MSDFVGTDGGVSSHSAMAESVLCDNEAVASASGNTDCRLTFFDISGFEYIGSPCSLVQLASLPSVESVSSCSEESVLLVCRLTVSMSS